MTHRPDWIVVVTALSHETLEARQEDDRTTELQNYRTTERPQNIGPSVLLFLILILLTNGEPTQFYFTISELSGAFLFTRFGTERCYGTIGFGIE
jgi:hypothetical protein